MDCGNSINGIKTESDGRNVLLLTAISVLIGIYLILTTVVIGKDGVYYIELAQRLSTDFRAAVKTSPFGYSLFILITHKLVLLFTDTSLVFTWIYTAQGLNLFCRTVVLIPLYYLGKHRVGPRDSFLAILILLVLPYPARFGSDIMSDWPHLLFLVSGFLLLLPGAGRGKWIYFLAAGVTAGIGYLIRVESMQLLLYGLAWIIVSFFYPRRMMSRPKLAFAAICLFLGFALTAGWCLSERGTVVTPKLKKFIETFSKENTNQAERINTHEDEPVIIRAEFVPKDFVKGSFTKGFVKICTRCSENLLYFFSLPLIIGLYRQLRNRRFMEESQFLLIIFILVNIAMLLMLYRGYGYISRRHVLPLVVFTVFCIPEGLRVCALWFDKIFWKKPGKSSGCDGKKFWFSVLFIAGIAICLPKLITPLRNDKRIYRDVAGWLSENTDPDDVILVFDSESQIPFYAQRQYVTEQKLWKYKGVIDFWVVRYEDEDKDELAKLEIKGKIALERYSASYLKREKTARLVVYEISNAVLPEESK